MFRGGVGRDVNVHVHVPLSMLCRWCSEAGQRDVHVHMHVPLLMLRWWCSGMGRGGEGCSCSCTCFIDDVTLVMFRGGVGWGCFNVHVHVPLMMLCWWCSGVGWGGVGRDAYVHVHVPVVMLRWWRSGVGWGGMLIDVPISVPLVMLGWIWNRISTRSSQGPVRDHARTSRRYRRSCRKDLHQLIQRPLTPCH